MVDKILIEKIVNNARDVRISEKCIRDFVEEHKNKDITRKISSHEHLLDNFSWKDKVNFVGIFSSQAFCFQPCVGEKKWRYNNMRGSETMWQCLFNSIEQGEDILNPNYWLVSDNEKIESLFIVNGLKPPLIKERVDILRDIGHSLEKIGGDFFTIFQMAEGGAVRCVNYLSEMKGFYDELFYKKAQLFTTMLLGWKDCWGDVEQISVCADYKIPFLMRERGILKYSDDLMCRIRDYCDLAGTDSEKEIRACTVWAGELLCYEFHKIGRGSIMPFHIDKFFWEMAGAGEGELPPHYAKTVAY